MLMSLHIENIAVIELADVEFSAGFNVMTGETGAGKSIVIDSLQAVLGFRAGRELVRQGAANSLISAVFSDAVADAWLEENCVDAAEEGIILTRRIARDGKSACRVNGVPVTVAQLRSLGELLLDIHGQNDGRRLLDERAHLEFLDSYGGYEDEIADFKSAYGEYIRVRREIERLTLDELERERLTLTLQYEMEELSEAAIVPGEAQELEKRRELMRNAGKLKEAIDGAYEALYGADASALAQIGEAAGWLGIVSGSSGELDEAEKTVREASILIEDAVERLRDFSRSLDFSSEEYDVIERRLSALRKVFRKYGEEELQLLERLENNRRRLAEIVGADERVGELRQELRACVRLAREAAAELTKARCAAAETLSACMAAELCDLSMPSVRFLVDISHVDKKIGFAANGADVVSFLISANPGEDPGRISRVASGGELSRVMLAMKTTFAEGDSISSMVFDEIDAGVSGIAAQRVGEKLASLSGNRQVICVTHLPQIAAMADTHFEILKTESEGRTFTRVNRLDSEGRKYELARLHGGENVTETTLLSAQEQLKAAQEFKARGKGEGK